MQTLTIHEVIRDTPNVEFFFVKNDEQVPYAAYLCHSEPMLEIAFEDHGMRTETLRECDYCGRTTFTTEI